MTGSPRSQSLLRTMSLEEKVAQLCCVDAAEGLDPAGALDVRRFDRFTPFGIGHLSSSGSLGDDVDALRSGITAVDEALTARSAHGIPPLVHAEALNGLVHPVGTQFSTPIGLAATWMPELVEAMTTVTALEMRELGIRLALSPVLDLARDARWGRVHETYGEDPLLAARFAVGFVRGLQGENFATGVAATAKHFLGYGASQAGLNHAVGTVGPRALRDEFARPFEAAIRSAGLSSVMNSYAEIDGIPVVANPEILTDLLRGELGFDGIVVSDYFSAIMLHSLHGVAATPADAAAQSLAAGLDVEFPRPNAFSHLTELVRDGKLDEAVVDRAALRVLGLKERLGLLDRAQVAAAGESFRPPARDRGREIAATAAAKGLTLLSNPGAVLPLGADIRRVAVIGELAESVRIHFGAYSAPAAAEVAVSGHVDMFSDAAGADYIGSVLSSWRAPIDDEAAAFEKQARELTPSARPVSQALAETGRWELVCSPHGGPEGTNDDDVAKAAAAAKSADVAVIVVGERTGWAGGLPTSGEGRDRETLDVPGNQLRLALAAAGQGVPTVAVLVSGRPLLVGELVDAGITILHAPLLGPSAGTAIAAALGGDAVPGGRTPVSWPRAAGQVPISAAAKRGSGYSHPVLPVPGYVDGPVTPQFPFGHGLSYTTFVYDGLLIDDEVPTDRGQLHIRFRVRNTGPADADEVVQVYIRDHVASVTRPLQQLIGFKRQAIAAGEAVEFGFSVSSDELGFSGHDRRQIVEPGEIDVYVGSSSDHLPLRGTTRLVGAVTPVQSDARAFGFDVQVDKA
jgi:beta-xylosidase